METNVKIDIDENLVLFSKKIESVLKKERIDTDVPLVDLGASSLNIVEIVAICVDIFPNLEDPDDLTLDEYTTVESLYNQLIELPSGN